MVSMLDASSPSGFEASIYVTPDGAEGLEMTTPLGTLHADGSSALFRGVQTHNNSNERRRGQVHQQHTVIHQRQAHYQFDQKHASRLLMIPKAMNPMFVQHIHRLPIHIFIIIILKIYCVLFFLLLLSGAFPLAFLLALFFFYSSTEHNSSTYVHTVEAE